MHSPASSCGRNVTEAVIWRNIAAISAWISASVFSGVGFLSVELAAAVAAFSWSTVAVVEEGSAVVDAGAAGLLEDLDLDLDFVGAVMLTCMIWRDCQC